MKKYALLAVGELLVDLVGTEVRDNLIDTNTFERFQGGSPANLAANMAKLGLQTALVASIGDDSIGKFLVEKVMDSGVDTQYVQLLPNVPSSMIMVSRTAAGMSDLISYRMADYRMHSIPQTLLDEVEVLHTSCWPLSLEPSSSAVLQAAIYAKSQGAMLSINLNYIEKVWPDRKNAYEVIQKYLALNPVVKLSEEDAYRFFHKNINIEDTLETLHQWGADIVCLTMGKRGSILSYEKGEKIITQDAEKIEVIDEIGTGDAFWAGFLAGMIKNQDPDICMKMAKNIAKIKLQTSGSIQRSIPINALI